MKISDLSPDEQIFYNKNFKGRKGIIFDDDKLKIMGGNIRTFDETNRELINNFIDEEKPDFILLNECNKAKSKLKISNYKFEFSDKQEVGIIYKDIYFLDSSFKELKDVYNLIKLVNAKMGRLILCPTYLPPIKAHDILIKEFINKIKDLNNRYNRYNNLNMFLLKEI